MAHSLTLQICEPQRQMARTRKPRSLNSRRRARPSCWRAWGAGSGWSA